MSVKAFPKKTEVIGLVIFIALKGSYAIQQIFCGGKLMILFRQVHFHVFHFVILCVDLFRKHLDLQLQCFFVGLQSPEAI